jgi:hypothetical protein
LGAIRGAKVAGTRPPRVPRGGVRVLAKAAMPPSPEQKPYGDPGSKKHEEELELGKPRWCPRPPLVR